MKNIRLQDGSTSTGSSLLARDWDLDVGDRDAEFKDDLRVASGIGLKHRKVPPSFMQAF